MNSLLSISEIKEEFSSAFKGAELEYHLSNEEFGKIHSFFIKTDTETTLNEIWRKTSNFIALRFQNNIQSEFERWNLYLFFFKPKEISNEKLFNELKHKIENDTFSSRKIVIEVPTDFESIINEHILNRNLAINFNTPELASQEFEPQTLLWEVIEGKVLKKQKRTLIAHNALDEIIKRLKASENEI